MSIFTSKFDLNTYFGTSFMPVRYCDTVDSTPIDLRYFNGIARFQIPANDSIQYIAADCIYEAVEHMSAIGPMGLHSPARIRVNHFTEQLYRRYNKDELADDPILLQIDCDLGKRDYYAVRLENCFKDRVQLIVMKV